MSRPISSAVPEGLLAAVVQLGELPVHIVATTGGVVDPGEVVAPANAYLVPFADHDAWIERASLVVGHGTAMPATRCRSPR